MKQYDVGVIGGGPAGYISAIKVAMLGGSVILFEKSVLEPVQNLFLVVK